MSSKSKKILNVLGLLTSCAVACACTGGTATPAVAAFMATAGGIAGNVGAEHFSKLFSLSGLNFFGKKETAGLHAELRKALIAAVSQSLEQIKREYSNPSEMTEMEELIASWKREAVGILESGQASVTAWNQLVIGETSLQSTLSDLGMQLYAPNEEYGQSTFKQFFLENFPVIFADYFQTALEKNQNAWLMWEVLQSKAHQTAILEMAQSLGELKEQQQLILEKLATFQFSVENISAQRSEFWNKFEADWQEAIKASLYNKIFIFCNYADRHWVETKLVPYLAEEGLPSHLDFREYTMDDWQGLSRNVADCKATIVLFSGKFSRNEKRLIGGLVDERPNRLNPICLDEAEVSEEFPDFIALSTKINQLENLQPLIARLNPTTGSKSEMFLTPIDPKYIEITNLPHGGTHNHLFGRQQELSLLDDAWDDPATHIICFVADGGVGKSCLINRWLSDMARDNYRGAQRVLATSFFSQGTGERVLSADRFINESLHWFGQKGFETQSAWDKGKLLARCVNEHKTLLVLDGLEPLQEGGVAETGKVKDPALFVLLRELAKSNRGLCIITTRQVLGGLGNHAGGIKTKNLEQISDRAATHILRSANIRGSEEALLDTVHRFGNHALAINLLSTYLYAFPGHPVEMAAQIPDLPKVSVEKGKHPRRVVAALEKMLEEKGNQEAVRLLRLMGLFDRPVSEGLFDRLDNFQNLSAAFRELRRYKLLYEENKHAPDEVDCHPLIREHYGEIMQQEHPTPWQQCHATLYEYYKALPEKELPDTLEEMEPLFSAVAHGCRAGLYNEAEYDVFWDRIRRGNKGFSAHKLGAFGSELTALSWFFEHLWDKPVETLPEHEKALILSWAGFGLRALGRLTEAVQPMKACLELNIKDENWRHAAINANNLSELYLIAGQVGFAVHYGEESVTYADRSGDGFQKESKPTTHADALHQAGQLEKATRLFVEAERMLRESQRGYRYLYSWWGYRYCDLLLSDGRVEEVLERGKTNMELEKKGWQNLLDFAWNRLAIGKAYRHLSQTHPTEAHRQHAIHYLDEAVTRLRKSGYQYHIPRGLLARAAWHRHQQEWSAAEADLAEVFDIAEPSGMKLFLTDYHLESARLCLAMKLPNPQRGSLDDAREHLEKAAQLVEETGYHRRDGEVSELRKQLGMG